MFTMMIIRHGVVKYYCQDRQFQILLYNPEAIPMQFQTKQDAIDAYDAWAMKHPATCRGWQVRIQEEE